jgi:hypothetical protein
MYAIQRSSFRVAALATAAVLLGGCAAATVSLSHKDLDVQTRTSTAVFVDPVAKPQRTVYLNVRSGVADFDRRTFSKFIRDQFASNEDGYQLVDDPDQAHFQLLVYVLNLEKASPDAAHAALARGYSGNGEIFAGALAGAAVGSTTHNPNGALAGAAVGGVLTAGASLVANSLVHDVTYMLVADVSIREKTAGALVRKDTSIDAKVSDSGTSQQRVSEVSDKKEYRTRIVTTANKANLQLPEAQDQMFLKTAAAMSGFF